MPENRRYNFSLSENLDTDLSYMSEKLQITKSETVRRALQLMRYAVDADDVSIDQRRVLIK